MTIDGQLTLDGAEVKLCAVCGRPFRFMRRTARYCSGACRMVAARERRGGARRPRAWGSTVRPFGESTCGPGRGRTFKDRGDGVCSSCGRTWGWHAGNSCFKVSATPSSDNPDAIPASDFGTRLVP